MGLVSQLIAPIVLTSSDNSTPQAILCQDNSGDSFPWRIYVGHFFVISSLLAIIVFLFFFIRRRNLFPVRERAPLLAIFQAIVFSLLIVVPYFTEIMLKIGIFDWDASSPEEVPMLRKVLKGFYMAQRVSCYLVFFFRYIFQIVNPKSACYLLELEA